MPIQEILQNAAITVNYAPMLAVLFLAVRMRVTWLTQGKGNPPDGRPQRGREALRQLHPGDLLYCLEVFHHDRSVH